jgi:hypothetical protein
MTNSSPDKHTFQKEGYIKRCEEQGKLPNPDYIEMYKSWRQQTLELEETDEWKIDNMEYDLRSTQWIIDKVKSDDVYAQHLYAAMCNNEFTKNDVWPILTEKRWSASWRHAGGIIADILEKGDYIDWYCSGIRDAIELDDDQFRDLTKEQQEAYIQGKAFVPESCVTDEIRQDLLKLGWIVIDNEDETH